MKRLEILVVAFLLLSSLALASPGTSDPSSVAEVQVRALPSEHGFPASALQQSELLEDFSRACADCRVVSDTRSYADFTLEVSDPGLVWEIRVLDAGGRLVKTVRGRGSLSSALEEAVSIMKSHLPLN